MNKIKRRAYYAIKPYVSWRLRLLFRRWLAKRTLRSAKGVWPILESTGYRPESWPGWPGGKQFAFVLTHDVEGLRGLNRVKRLAEVEMDLDFFRSSFNLIPEGDYLPPKDLREWLTGFGFEVGVHDLHHNGSLFRSASFDRQVPRINHYLGAWRATGFRAAFMFHNLDWIRELDIEYDASTFDTDPFEPQPDAAGTIFPFWVPPKNGRPGYVELPYTLVQDSTLFLLLRERTADIWKRKLDWVAQHGGMALVNVHPDYVKFGEQAPSLREFPVARYVDLLTYVRDRYAGRYWNVVPRELAAWFKSEIQSNSIVSRY